MSDTEHKLWGWCHVCDGEVRICPTCDDIYHAEDDEEAEDHRHA